MDDKAYSRFRRTAVTVQNCIKDRTTKQVLNNSASVNIQVLRTREWLKVALIINDKEGVDEDIVLALLPDDIRAGDIFSWNDHGIIKYFLAYEAVSITTEVGYKKFRALECNVQINNELWGCFKGNMRSFKDSKLNKDSIVSSLSPLLIVPQSYGLQANDYIIIQKQKWHIVDSDTITNRAVGYYYLTRTANEEIVPPIEPNVYKYSGEQITIPTEQGYFVSNVEITQKINKGTSVIFTIPKMTGELIIETKQNNQIITTSYDVKEFING